MSSKTKGIKLELQWYARGAYPEFVTSTSPSPLGDRQVPVFMFHSISRHMFESQLNYLFDNGYNTLTADELCGFMTAGAKIPENSVVLTFDDGEESLYEVGLPLLKQYRMKAVAFICPGRMREEGEVSDAPRSWLTWPHVKKLHSSGHVDIQSHGYDHERMFCGPDITGFYDGSDMGNELGTDVPMVRVDGEFDKLSSVGAPVYEMASRLSDRKRYYDDEILRNACAKFVQEIEKEYFVRSRRGISVMMKYVKEYRLHIGDKGSFETEEEQREAIYRNLSLSREQIENRIGKTVEHLAYPWGYGGEMSVEESRKAGFKSNWWGVLDKVKINVPGGDVFRITRLKDDYIFRLPGKGRHSLASVIGQKIIRRMAKRDIY